jgi:hypothetical protein
MQEVRKLVGQMIEREGETHEIADSQRKIHRNWEQMQIRVQNQEHQLAQMRAMVSSLEGAVASQNDESKSVSLKLEKTGKLRGSGSLSHGDLDLAREIVQSKIDPIEETLSKIQSRLSQSEDSEHRLRHHVKKLILANSQQDELWKIQKTSEENLHSGKKNMSADISTIQTQVQELDRNLAVLIREHHALVSKKVEPSNDASIPPEQIQLLIREALAQPITRIDEDFRKLLDRHKRIENSLQANLREVQNFDEDWQKKLRAIEQKQTSTNQQQASRLIEIEDRLRTLGSNEAALVKLVEEKVENHRMRERAAALDSQNLDSRFAELEARLVSKFSSNSTTGVAQPTLDSIHKALELMRENHQAHEKKIANEFLVLEERVMSRFSQDHTETSELRSDFQRIQLTIADMSSKQTSGFARMASLARSQIEVGELVSRHDTTLMNLEEAQTGFREEIAQLLRRNQEITQAAEREHNNRLQMVKSTADFQREVRRESDQSQKAALEMIESIRVEVSDMSRRKHHSCQQTCSIFQQNLTDLDNKMLLVENSQSELHGRLENIGKTSALSATWIMQNAPTISESINLTSELSEKLSVQITRGISEEEAKNLSSKMTSIETKVDFSNRASTQSINDVSREVKIAQLETSATIADIAIKVGCLESELASLKHADMMNDRAMQVAEQAKETVKKIDESLVSIREQLDETSRASALSAAWITREGPSLADSSRLASSMEAKIQGLVDERVDKASLEATVREQHAQLTSQISGNALQVSDLEAQLRSLRDQVGSADMSSGSQVTELEQKMATLAQSVASIREQLDETSRASALSAAWITREGPSLADSSELIGGISSKIFSCEEKCENFETALQVVSEQSHSSNKELLRLQSQFDDLKQWQRDIDTTSRLNKQKLTDCCNVTLQQGEWILKTANDITSLARSIEMFQQAR